MFNLTTPYAIRRHNPSSKGSYIWILDIKKKTIHKDYI